MPILYRGQVRNSEVDSQGIVHHAKYLYYMECARINHFNKIGSNLYELAQNGIDLVVTSISISYIKPLTVDEFYYVESIIGVNLPVKYTFKNIIYNNDGEKCVEADIEGCAMIRKSKKIDRYYIKNDMAKNLDNH
jgi:acyl-CoA thioester hydrolase